VLTEPSRPQWAGEFAVCPKCGADGGFHLVLERMHESTEPAAKAYLKCPSCKELFDIDIKLLLA